jgi:hypothetical protein
MDAELIEGNYVLYQGDLSTKGVGTLRAGGKRFTLRGTMARALEMRRIRGSTADETGL